MLDTISQQGRAEADAHIWTHGANRAVASKAATRGRQVTNPHDMKDDQALALRIQQGDERAFQEMYRTYAPLILRRLSRWIGDTQNAEDCLQQVFLEALRSIEKYRGEGKLSGWLNRIATHVVMDMFRQKKRVKNLMERVMPEQRVAISEEDPGIPEALFLREEVRELVHEILNKLSAQKRMAILLCDLEGLPLEEAATQMGVPLGTVGSRLYHGRREFQKRAQDEFRRRGLSIQDLMQ